MKLLSTGLSCIHFALRRRRSHKTSRPHVTDLVTVGASSDAGVWCLALAGLAPVLHSPWLTIAAALAVGGAAWLLVGALLRSRSDLKLKKKSLASQYKDTIHEIITSKLKHTWRWSCRTFLTTWWMLSRKILFPYFVKCTPSGTKAPLWRKRMFWCSTTSL